MAFLTMEGRLASGLPSSACGLREPGVKLRRRFVFVTGQEVAVAVEGDGDR